ncbi:MAG: discoidin domain-containing protein [Clostridia bacterium]|nr:discoidin domain-containing protein [Clostridia bacterium]
MKIKKALTCIFTALIICASTAFTACGNTDKPDVPSGEAPKIEQPERTVTQSKLTVYEGPALLESSSKLKAYVEDEELFVYDTRVNHNRIFSFSYSKDKGQVVNFDFEGKVHMRVEINGATSLTDVVVRPLSYGVEPKVSGNTVEFDLEYSANYTLEYNDGKVTDAADNALHIFANPIEENPVTADNVPEDTIYIGPGVYAASAIPMKSNQTLYLAGGAYVYGQVRAENLENITIRGRGIMSGEIYDRRADAEYTLPIELRFCKNVTIEGITLLDPAGWAVTLYHSENVKINNLKIITARGNGDGISVQSCKDVTVNGGFVRTFDDSLVVKNTDRGNTENIVFDNVVVWTDLAQSMEVGFETNGKVMKDITFKNITVLHNYHKAVMSIHNCDDADISNVVYESITVEDGKMLGDNQNDGLEDYLIDITIAYNINWSKSDERGTVNGVRFENIKVLDMADSIVSRINGESAQKNVSNVLIRGVEIEGKKIDTAEKLKLANNTYVDGISVNAAAYDVFGAGVKLPYKLDLAANDTVTKTVKQTTDQKGLEVPDFAILDVQETFMGNARDMSAVVTSVTHGKGTTAKAEADDGSGAFDSASNPVANALDGDRETSFKAKSWTNETDEFIAVTLDFGEKLPAGSVSVIRVFLPEDSAYVYDFNVSVFNRKDTDGNFARSLNSITYTASPATGNYFDIRLSATLESSALQLRFFRVDGMTGQNVLEISEIKIFPCSLSTTKAVIDSTAYFDVYGPNNLVDGNDNTYWETSPSDCDGAFFTVDLGARYDVSDIIMHLPPLLTWEERVQRIEILVSLDGTNWTTAVAATEYTFDPVTGNVNSIKLNTPVSARYIKLLWSSNSSSRYGAQLSELYVYGV